MSVIFELAEPVFISLEGEAQYTNHPTVYLRLARCNFTCYGFNNPHKHKDDRGYAPIYFDPKDYKSLKDIPIIETGCDSQYAVNPKFAHLWEKKTADEVVDDLINLLPTKTWQHPKTNQNYIFSITGGEPTLHWKKIESILFHPKMKDCRHIIFETNASVKISDEFIVYLYRWLSEDSRRKWTWSNSPKLECSGEDFSKAIVPSVVRAQNVLKKRFPNQVDIYFKFVCSGEDADWIEIESVMEEYYLNSDINLDTQVWIMPMACIQEQQSAIMKKLAEQCIQRGYLFCYRMQNLIWGNGVGT